jgi:hypothetical protein
MLSALALASAFALGANPHAIMETSMGVFKMELFLDTMPLTASNFIDLAERSFFE